MWSLWGPWCLCVTEGREQVREVQHMGPKGLAGVWSQKLLCAILGSEHFYPVGKSHWGFKQINQMVLSSWKISSLKKWIWRNGKEDRTFIRSIISSVAAVTTRKRFPTWLSLKISPAHEPPPICTHWLQPYFSAHPKSHLLCEPSLHHFQKFLHPLTFPASCLFSHWASSL